MTDLLSGAELFQYMIISMLTHTQGIQGLTDTIEFQYTAFPCYFIGN
jgi:hypothetical protein